MCYENRTNPLASDRTDVRVMGQADCSFVFGLFLQELSLLALMESADPRLISSVGSWP